MKINKEGKLEIDIYEIVETLSPEDFRVFIKTHCISSQVIDWAVNWILGEDEDGWFGNDAKLREEILARIEQKHCGYITKYNWTLISEAADALKRIASQKHIYWKLYHHPNKYHTTIADFIGNSTYEDNEYSTDKADALIEQVLTIVKNAVKPAKETPENSPDGI